MHIQNSSLSNISYDNMFSLKGYLPVSCLAILSCVSKKVKQQAERIILWKSVANGLQISVIDIKDSKVTVKAYCIKVTALFRSLFHTLRTYDADAPEFPFLHNTPLIDFQALKKCIEEGSFDFKKSLSCAVMEQPRTAHTMLDLGIKPQWQDLVNALVSPDRELLKRLLINPAITLPADYNAQNHLQILFTQAVLSTPHLDILLRHGGRLFPKNLLNTPGLLQQVIRKAELNKIRILMRNGVKPTLADVQEAADHKSEKVRLLEVIFMESAKLFSNDNLAQEGQLMDEAIQKGDTKFAEILIKYGAIPKEEDIAFAEQTGNKSMIKLLKKSKFPELL